MSAGHAQGRIEVLGHAALIPVQPEYVAHALRLWLTRIKRPGYSYRIVDLLPLVGTQALHDRIGKLSVRWRIGPLAGL